MVGYKFTRLCEISLIYFLRKPNWKCFFLVHSLTQCSLYLIWFVVCAKNGSRCSRKAFLKAICALTLPLTVCLCDFFLAHPRFEFFSFQEMLNCVCHHGKSRYRRRLFVVVVFGRIMKKYLKSLLYPLKFIHFRNEKKFFVIVSLDKMFELNGEKIEDEHCVYSTESIAFNCLYQLPCSHTEDWTVLCTNNFKQINVISYHNYNLSIHFRWYKKAVHSLYGSRIERRNATEQRKRRKNQEEHISNLSLLFRRKNCY